MKDARLSEERIRDGYRMAIAWEAVARLMQYRALTFARKAGQVLLYSQAIDIPTQGMRGVGPEEFRKALQVVNMTKTGYRLGMCPRFVGMRVRPTAKLSAKYKVVQDAVGVVQAIIFDEREFDASNSDWRSNSDHRARKR